jgi:hypothetical protein
MINHSLGSKFSTQNYDVVEHFLVQMFRFNVVYSLYKVFTVLSLYVILTAFQRYNKGTELRYNF